MATWQAEVKVKNPGDFFKVTVDANSYGSAKDIINHIYSPYSMRNLRQVSSSSSSSSSSDSDDVGAEGIFYLIVFAVLIWIFATFTPVLMMGFGGAFGTWVSQKITGQTLMEYGEREDDSGHGRFLIVLAVTMILGGYGFVKGVEIQNYLNSPTPSIPSEVKPAK